MQFKLKHPITFNYVIDTALKIFRGYVSAIYVLAALGAGVIIVEDVFFPGADAQPQCPALSVSRAP